MAIEYRFRTVGMNVREDAKPWGVVFRVKLSDATEQTLPYAVAFKSKNLAAYDYAMHRMSQLAQALEISNIFDTTQLHNLEMIVTHDGTAIKKLEPVHTRVAVPTFFPPWYVRLWRLMKSEF